MKTGDLGTIVRAACQHLADSSESPKLDAQILAGHVLGKSREWVIAHTEEQLEPALADSILALVERRRSGEPVAYLTGQRSFWKQTFLVSRDTLIPRPETELLVEILLARCDAAAREVVDLGTGSGAIAVSLASERPAWKVTATDVSGAALAVARKNASGLNNIRFVASDWFDALDGRFDIIVSNPPYVAADDPHLESLEFEPLLALIAGPDGLNAIRTITADGYHRLNPGGILLLEHGFEQADAVQQLMLEAGFTAVESLQDLQGHRRASIARRE